MKRWIINILQYIINSIESEEEDDTLPEDYFNKIRTINKMTEEEQKKVFKLYQINSSLKPEFSCSLCKQVLKISTCKNCPIYCQTFNPD